MPVLNVTDQTFDAEVLNSELPVLVDFWAPWCGPCQMMTPIVDELAEELDGRARVVKVNIDAAKGLAVQYRIDSIPSFAVIHNGEVQNRVKGGMPKEQLRSLVEPHLNG